MNENVDYKQFELTPEQMREKLEFIDLVREMSNFDTTWNDIGVEYKKEGKDIRRAYKRLTGGA